MMVPFRDTMWWTRTVMDKAGHGQVPSKKFGEINEAMIYTWWMVTELRGIMEAISNVG